LCGSCFVVTSLIPNRLTVFVSCLPVSANVFITVSLLYLQGKYDIAEHMIQENQVQCQSVLGADHPLTLRHINNHAANFEAQGQFRKAELLYKQCLVKRRLSQGATHPETLSSCNNLACLYVKQLQQIKEAERMFKECLKERQKVVGLRHPDTLSTINNMATLYWRTDRMELAHDVYIDCAEECVEQLGRGHPVSVTALGNLQEMVNQMRGTKAVVKCAARRSCCNF
jgi:tetratricopeptide (TPR) repeat protein